MQIRCKAGELIQAGSMSLCQESTFHNRFSKNINKNINT